MIFFVECKEVTAKDSMRLKEWKNEHNAETGPLAQSCTYLSYESLKELAGQKHLAHVSDTVLDEYAEEAE